ncbi:tetratricopeptide repeat protein (macronuclear) [Tetrahymena thermophila SB210]|uniref:Tetratricopeptide repeat protein n=1 Tax=Tetrahymena thermophila (strain SB210) TaxID=312017 RepID=Q22KP0_TETTS|nr:tetratricopeptide repeat protein [Tetrahymena thermophila SB210]EAR85759.2 tetratricopeptide repeat protein [Tetrahymena thermophila SB210]|eukprot:XP_001033422.2 tetratricopeptide repeat protein [Tetrahymena thermophila SB210]
MNEVEIVKEVKRLFYKSLFKECIETYNNYQQEYTNFLNFQIATLYKSLSYFYIDQFDEVSKNINSLILKSEQKNNGQINQFDLIIRIFYMQQMFDENFYAAEQQNIKFKDLIDKYQQNKSSYELKYDSIYLFAKGFYQFIDNWRNEADLQCIQLMKDSLALDDQYKQDINFIIGWIYAQKDQYDEALKYFLNLEQENSDYPGILNSIGVTYSRLKQREKAEEYYYKSHNKFPMNTLYINNLAQFYSQNKNIDECKELFMKSLKINPNKVLTLYFYGYFLCKQKQCDEGMQYLLKGLEINPQSTDICNALANINKELSDIEKSEFYYKKCIELEPLNGQFYEAIGMFYIDEGMFDEAIDYFKKALTMKLFRVNYHSTSSNLAYCLYELERWEESLDYYIQSLDYPVIFDTTLDIESICFILDSIEIISLNRKIEILSLYNKNFLSRLDLIIEKLENIQIKYFLKQKQALFRQFLSIEAYLKFIQPNLIYMNEISHWDLYID